jgi:hypothetical protein
MVNLLGQQDSNLQDSASDRQDLHRLHDVNQSARILGRSHWWLRELVKRGRVGFIRVGGQRRLMFPASELLRLLANQKSK